MAGALCKNKGIHIPFVLSAPMVQFIGFVGRTPMEAEGSLSPV